MKYFHSWALATALCAVTLLLTVNSCTDEIVDPPPTDTLSLYLKFIEGSQQRVGNPELGLDYLKYGDIVDHGVPIDLYSLAFGNGDGNLLNRDGDNAQVSYNYTALNAPNGVRVVSPNCLSCHAQTLNGQLIVGLGNSVADFTTNAGGLIPIIDALVTSNYGANSPEWDAYFPFRRGSLAIGPNIVTEKQGVNVADNLAAILAAHRNPATLEWSEQQLLNYPDKVIPVDVPAWWLLRKKNSMFWTALGRGDYAKVSMASSMLTMRDTTKARQVNEHFGDVMAYLNTIEPPAYPQTIDQNLVTQGKTIFAQNCQRCHGSYGVNETYPNLLVSLDIVKTDSVLANEFFELDEFVEWYNQSWFNTEPFPAQLVAERGYIAPPLDGIWATAPYLHNASVPTLDDLLNSVQRPTYWERSFVTDDIDYQKVGWNYETRNAGGTKTIYDTTLPGYGNQGHTFGDKLSDEERIALIEYLKTL